MADHSNHLIGETSPYLLQHAHNPVQWYPWGEKALAKAVEEDKPILVSIGYAACHWCHVMEKESFEDEETAAMMNEHFINIKIDREERPDLDHIYMNAVQTMTGSGGWPLNVFLTPRRKPFYGGTYYPPAPAFNRPSWKQVLQGVINAYYEKRDQLEKQAENLTAQIVQSGNFGISNQPQTEIAQADIENAYRNAMASADKVMGGFGAAPKFPQTFTILFLLRYFYYTHNEEARAQATLSLNSMIHGGIYDQVGGGFARYSTDGEWLAPHFEKMLYDNALLLSAMCEAWQVTHDRLYAKTVAQTMDFVERELMSDEAGFFSALDADSEGVEGKYYVWSKQEVEQLLGDDASFFCAYYDISEHGNWEGKNILRVIQPLQAFSAGYGLSIEKAEEIITRCSAKLLEERRKRVPPGLDDKILLGWNALMNTACSKAFAAFGNEQYRQLAVRNMDFLLKNFFDEGNREWKHGYKNGIATNPAFLDDYAHLIQALIHLQEITGNTGYLLKAKQLSEWVIDRFTDEESGLFFYTHRNQQDVIIRIKEIYDGATASGNATMAWNLLYLSLIFDNSAFKSKAGRMVTSLAAVVSRYPTSFGMWAMVMQGIYYGKNEIAIVGDRYNEILSDVLACYIPDRVIQSSLANNETFPLLAGRYVANQTNIYLCRDFSCKKPVQNAVELTQLIDQERKR
ncbi:MAG: thioredoxin domain-containing protein [Chitinophagaceae bacterium]|nr:thioredoxin domain-containing protein [Chitinophagaceae bacterium]